jgi:Ca-activated chloride channel family protein
VKEYRLIGYENRILAEEDFNNDKVDAGDIGRRTSGDGIVRDRARFWRGWLPERRYEANRAAVKPSGPDSEMAWLKLRYKLPDGDKSMLIERPVPASWISSAAAPRETPPLQHRLRPSARNCAETISGRLWLGRHSRTGGRTARLSA